MARDFSQNPDPSGSGAAETPSSPGPRAAASSGGPGIARELGGDLLCVSCGYNLRGLSIRGTCPECGVAIRATILHIVDPLASELRPIRFPRLTAGGLVLWALGAAIASIGGWLPQLLDLAHLMGVPASVISTWSSAGVFRDLLCYGLIASGVGSIALVRPHAGIRARVSLMALGASLLYLPLLLILLRIFADATGVHTAPGSSLIVGARPGPWRYVRGWTPDEYSTMLAVLFNAMIGAIVLLQRPVVRLLVARSLVMRSGRVDRQTMLAMAGAAGVAIVGHILGYTGAQSAIAAGAFGSPLRALGLVLVAMGSLLLTVGFWGGLIDSVRIARAVLMPSPSLRHVIRHGHIPSNPLKPASGVHRRDNPEATDADKSEAPHPRGASS